MIRSLGRIFQSRFRGFRIVDLSAFGCLAVLVLGVYAFKADQGGENARIEDVDDQIANEQRQIRALRAQLAHLEEPARLERLSVRYLGLTPTSAKRETSVDALIDISRQAEAARVGALKDGGGRPSPPARVHASTVAATDAPPPPARSDGL